MGRRGPVKKRVLDHARLRRIRDGFSWVDRRFVSDGWIERLTRDEITLYLFLVTVADRDGLSFYSEPRIAGTLKLACEDVARARQRLVDLELVAFEKPLYQVLALKALERPWS